MMDITHFLITVFSGLAGTVAMTGLMYLYAYISKRFPKAIHILGNMVIGERNYYTSSRNTLLVGTVAHFGIGIHFSFAYFLL